MNAQDTKRRRIVVTGMGAVTPIGLTIEEYWNNSIAGKSGVGLITRFDAEKYDTKIAAELKGFNPLNYLERKEANRMDPFAQFALASAEMAIKDSGIDLEKTDRERAGVIFGSGIGGMLTWHQQMQVY